MGGKMFHNFQEENESSENERENTKKN